MDSVLYAGSRGDFANVLSGQSTVLNSQTRMPNGIRIRASNPHYVAAGLDVALTAFYRGDSGRQGR
jgi:hypothetical protein